MADYTFETLNSTDFEHLVRDLMNARERSLLSGIVFRTFGEGKDRGIDLLDSSSKPPSYNSIVQVKHQPNVTFETLLRQLVRSTKTITCELDKVKKLNPHRYIFATSRSLSLLNKEAIVDGMKPFIHSVGDIIDKEELNRLLTEYPEVERSHPKLWFSSVAVFNSILHNDVHGRSDQLAADIQQKLKLYVPVYSISAAISILERAKFIVISGEPGCGKTTFAEMILFKLAGMGFTAYWIDKSVSEIEKIIMDDSSRQVFYFDDFLGHTRYEIETGRSQEKGLLHFLQRLARMTNKYFILTTRTSLINSAAADSERFRHSGLFRDKQEIIVSELSENNKVRMIRNHLDVREVPPDYRKNLTGDSLAAIAAHKNFSPRLIGFVTLKQNYDTVRGSGYFDYIMSQLDNPHEVWLHAYEEQLDDFDRVVLTTLYSFGNAVKDSQLQRAFEERLEYEVTYNHLPRPTNPFSRSFKKLLGSFVSYRRFYEGERVDFINPSLEDFLSFYLKDNNPEKLRIANSIAFVEQAYSRFRPSQENYLSLVPGEIFRKRIESAAFDTTNEISPENKPSYIALYTAVINQMFFRDSKGTETTLQFLKKVAWDELERVNYFHLSGFLKAAIHADSLSHFIRNHFEHVVIALLKCCQSLENISGTRLLFDEYEQDYAAFISIQANRTIVKSQIDFFFEDEVRGRMEDLIENATDIVAVGETREEIEQEIVDIYEIMEIEEPANLHGFDDQNWESICAANLFSEQMRRNDEAAGPIRIDGEEF